DRSRSHILCASSSVPSIACCLARWTGPVRCVSYAMTALHDMTAADLLAAYKTRKLSPVETMDAVIAHIERWEPKLKALYAPDFGMLSSGRSSFHPLTRNPWNLAWNPGGSSAGAGAAAAAGYGPLHLGTDIGGSLRLPASWNGIFTLKPSLGRVPVDPPYFGRAVGPMTRTVADSALLMAELSKPDPRDHMSLPPAAIDWSAGPPEPKGLKIGLHLDAGSGPPAHS